MASKIYKLLRLSLKKLDVDLNNQKANNRFILQIII